MNNIPYQGRLSAIKDFFLGKSEPKKGPSGPRMPVDEGAEVPPHEEVVEARPAAPANVPPPPAQAQVRTQPPAASPEKQAAPQSQAGSPQAPAATPPPLPAEPPPPQPPPHAGDNKPAEAAAGPLQHQAKPPRSGERPVIGILTDAPFNAKDDNVSMNQHIYMTGGTKAQYQSAVEENGGSVRWIYDDGRTLEDQLAGLHGLVVPGGPDLNPQLYGQLNKGSVGTTPLDFDVWEINISQKAIEKGIPLRGICRGQQILNIAYGGTLMQDIKSHLSMPYTYEMEHRNKEHNIVMARGSRLFGVLKQESLMVKSNHHQAIDFVSPYFAAVARSADGVIEAIEMKDNDQVMAVQFHPERAKDEVRNPFFQDLTAQANARWDNIGGAGGPAPVKYMPPPVQSSAPAKSSGTSSQGASREQALRDGVKMLAQRGLYVKRFGKDMTDWDFRNFDQLQGGEFTIDNGEAKEVWRCKKEPMAAMLFSVTPQGTGHLNEESRRLLVLIQRLESAGAKFFRADNGFKKKGYENWLPVISIWTLWDKKLQIGFKDHASGEQRLEKVDSEDSLRALLAVVEPPPAAQPAAPPAEAQPVVQTADAPVAGTEPAAAPPQPGPAQPETEQQKSGDKK